jgi:hypothetical protein
MEMSKSNIFDIVYGYEPMTKTLAEEIRRLRCDHKMVYEKVPAALNAGFGDDFTLGKELCSKARAFLGESDKGWD